MKITYSIYVVEDKFENKTAVVAEEGFQTIQICGLKNSKGNEVHFESEAYHLEEFARKNKWNFKKIDLSQEI